MRVSIVITNHDYERFVSDAIDSALAQEHDDVEVVVVDDGSADGSRSVIERYGERVVALLRPHGGQGAAVNAGFAACTGDAVLFMDPDDVLLPGAAQEIARVLADPAVAKVHWPMLLGDEAAEPAGDVYPAEPLDEGDLRERLWHCPRHTTPPMSGNAYSRACLERILPMPEAPFPAGADCYLYHLAMAFGEVRTASRPLSIYRKHAASISAQPLSVRRRRWAELDDAAWSALAEVCEQQGLPGSLETWRRNSWNHRVADAVDAIAEHVPAGERFVLVDDNGSLALEADPAVQWWGLPDDGEQAVVDLGDLRAGGARYAVVAFPAFWWLAYYRELREHLGRHRLVAADHLVRVYDLEAPAETAAAADTVAVVLATTTPERRDRALAMLGEQDGVRAEVHVADASGVDQLRVAAGLAERFDRVVLLDDGIDLAPNTLALLLAEHASGMLVAHEATRFDRRGAARPCAAWEAAHVVTTRAAVVDAAVLRDPELLAGPPEHADVWLSYVAAYRHGQRLHPSAAPLHVAAPGPEETPGATALLRELADTGWAVPVPPAPGASAKRVAIFREQFLPPSETFVRNHILDLPSWKPLVVTMSRVEGGLEVPGVAVTEVHGGGLTRVLEQQDAALVHAQFGPDGAMVREAANRLGLPLVVTFLGYDATMYDEFMRQWPAGAHFVETRDALFDDAVAIIALSRYLRDSLVERGADPAKITVIPCGVDTEELPWTPAPPDGGIVFVGRLVDKKGCADLLEAVSMLETQPRLRILGDGPLRASLEQRAREVDVAAEFVGVATSEQVRDAMQAASIVAMPSKRAPNGDCEGLPLVSLEASALGRPVVGYRHSGLVDSVRSGETGLLTEEGDVEGLARMLGELLADPAEIERLGANARRHIQSNFERSDCLRRVEEVYEAVVAAAAPPPRPIPAFCAADPAHSAWLASEIWNGEYDEVGFIAQPGWKVVDVGANVGVFSLLAAARGARVEAYEPHPETFAHLERNATGHDVVCQRAAIVAEAPPSGTVSLFLGSADTRHSLLAADQASDIALAEHVDVPALRVHEVLRGGCDLLKLDCEGVEFDLLDSLSSDDLAGLRRLVVELHGSQEQMDAFEARLRDEGYTTFRRALENERLALCFARR